MIKSIFISITLFISFNIPLLAIDNYSIGFQKINVLSKKTNEQFSVAVVYPTKIPAKPVMFGPFAMELSIGSAIAKGKFPLVIISHGSGGSNIAHRSIAFALVKMGFVVGMPLHPKNNFKNNSDEGTVSNWRNRPKHIKSAIDDLLSNQKFSTSIDANKIAVIGHSAGGYAALAVAGGVANTKHMIDLCVNNPQIPEPFCGLVKENRIESEEIANPRDKRVKAIVLMAPLGILFKSKNSLSKVDIPLLLIKAQKDGVLTEPYHSDTIAINYNGKQLTFRTIANAGHYSFITPLPQAIENEFGVIAKDPEGFDRKAFHKTLSQVIGNYLIDALN